MHTIDTIMASISNLRVHIAPVGFEVDRIVIPAEQMRADKVWLLIHENPSEDKARPFIERVTKQLKKSKIQVYKEHHNRLDLFQIIKSVRRIIEKEQGNLLYVNLSSGSKIQAIALMMACMMFNKKKTVTPYYAEAKSYLGFEGQEISTGVKDTFTVPTYEIQTPKQKHLQALKIIKDKGGVITKKEMAELSDKNKIIQVNAEKENYTQARFASLDKNIIQPLRDQWNFVEEEKIGRTRWIRITEEGNNAAELLI